MELPVTQSAIDAAYTNMQDRCNVTQCLLATAAMEQLGTDNVTCGNIYITINNVRYNMDRYTARMVDEWCHNKHYHTPVRPQPFIAYLTPA